MNLADFRAHLESCGCRPTGNATLSAKCPAHADSTASLSVSEGNDGRLLIHCHAGCAPEAIVGALNLKMADLFIENPKRNGADIVATYDYEDENGVLLFQVCRLDPKSFRQRKPDGNGGWIWKMDGVRRVPFLLPQLIKGVVDGAPVFVCEGEKDCLALVKRGIVATCNPGGAGKWRRDFGAYFKGAVACIIADKDGTGRKHAQEVAASLHGVAARVRVIECPDLDGKVVKDAADFFAAGGKPSDLIGLADDAPDWTAKPARIEAPAPAGGIEFDKETARVRGEIIGLFADKDLTGTERNRAIAEFVVEALCRVGKLYFNADLRDFDSSMFFNAYSKELLRIRSDAFNAWLASWIAINRADACFKFVVAAVETAALADARSTGIVPEAYWASRLGALYLSNGDGRVVKVTADGVIEVDNGADSVLFAAGKTLAPWKLVSPCDPFETCALFAKAHCDAEHGQALLRLWVYSLPTNPRSKPPLCLAGDVGSGKTRTVKGIAELLGVPFIAQKVEADAEGQFWPAINAGGIYCLDNADTRCAWLADALANAATDGCSQRRRLYTNSETVTLRARAWLTVTTANPTFASDAGLADRLLLVRMGRRQAETADGKLSDEIAVHRDAALSHMAVTLQRALADTVQVPAGLNARHPDFAAFAVRIGRALGRESEAVDALQAAENDKATFCLENDPVGAALLAMLRASKLWTGTAAELLKRLKEADPDLCGTRADGKPAWGAKRLGKRITALWPHVAKAFPGSAAEKDRNGVSVFRFVGNQADAAGFAGFQTAVP